MAPTSGELEQLRTARSGYQDLDLPAQDRRTRAETIVDRHGAAVASSDVVSGLGTEAAVIGLGRGVGWYEVAWIEDLGDGPEVCVGTAHRSQIERTGDTVPSAGD